MTYNERLQTEIGCHQSELTHVMDKLIQARYPVEEKEYWEDQLLHHLTELEVLYLKLQTENYNKVRQDT